MWVRAVVFGFTCALCLGCDDPGDRANTVSVQQELAEQNLPKKPGWPTMFGPYLNSTSAETDLNWDWPEDGPPEVWRKRIGKGYSVPVVFDGRLILFHRQGDEEILECLETETGEPLWDFRYATAYECLYEYSNGPYGSPVIADGRVFAVGAEGKAHCLDLETGEKIWSRDLLKDFEIEKALFGVGAGILIEDDKLIFNVGGKAPNSGIIALETATGKTVWQATEDGPSYCMPKAATMHERRIVIALTYFGLVGLNPEDGHVHFREKFHPTAVDTVNATSPLIIGNRVFVAAGPGPGCRVYEVQPDFTGKEIWKERRALDSQFNNLVALDGYVYGYTSKWNGGATFNCVKLADGELQWKKSSDLVRGSTIAVENKFLMWGEYGHLARLSITPDETDFEFFSKEPLLKSPCYTAPALSDGLLFLRNERELLCLSLRKDSAETSEPKE